ncbi:hypothetical protein C0991_010978 [Blastosporella zonata]|nr:hypothetical protein C0991_010978 [Blastosporella zonata]
MSALLGKAGKKLFAKHLEQYRPEDPLYEFYTDSKGRKKRKKVRIVFSLSNLSLMDLVQRDIPPGLSKRDANILKSVQKRAHYLDKGFSILGFRFGWTFIIGLIPVVGDAANVSLNYLLVIRKARQADIPPWLLQRMFLHNIVGAGVGFIPLVGDVMFAVYKPNSRNAALLEEMLRIRGEEYIRLQAGETIVASKSEEDKKGKGVSKSDADQVKPGAGFIKGEGAPAEPASTSSAIAEVALSPSPAKKKSFGFLGMSSKKSTE